MISNQRDNFFSLGYFGELSPNTKEFSLRYEKELGLEVDPSMIYQYNNIGFRCDNFIKEHVGTHVLFGGCSETEGASNLLEDTWSHVLYNKIKNDINASGYYNVGKTGLTTPLIILNIFQYISDYGIPDYIFLQLPDHSRYLSWSEEKLIHPVYRNKKELTKLDSKFLDFFTKGGEMPELNINIFFSNFILRTLIQFCKINSVKLYWSTWQPDSYPVGIFTEYDSSDYVLTAPSGKDHWGIKIEDLVARDGFHFGKGFHKVWAEKFYEEFINDKNN